MLPDGFGTLLEEDAFFMGESESKLTGYRGGTW